VHEHVNAHLYVHGKGLRVVTQVKIYVDDSVGRVIRGKDPCGRCGQHRIRELALLSRGIEVISRCAFWFPTMIVETIFSTLDESGRPNFAPMGIEWGQESLKVRPFRNTRTCRNLLSTGYGVVNLADDVLAYVRCALYDAILPYFPAKTVPGVVFSDTCSWREVRLISQSGSDERAELICRVLHDGRQKDFVGFRRAGNAVIEATILATRLTILDRNTLADGMNHYGKIIGRIGDDTEKQAFQLVQEYVETRGNQ